MQVFGLPGQVTRNGRRASRLLDAEPPNIQAERRRDAVARRQASWVDGRASGRGGGRAASHALPLAEGAGSEEPAAMAEFETACAAKAIPLYVLPPRSPKLNRAVERYSEAIRILFSHRPAQRHRQNCRPRRRLPASLQPLQATRCSRRQNPKPVSSNQPSQRTPRVSYVLSQDKVLTALRSACTCARPLVCALRIISGEQNLPKAR